MKTEEDAKELWCPYSRVGEQASGAAENRPDGSYNCIASQCAAWRWEMLFEPIEETSISDKLSEQRVRRVRGKHGWCGLAGKPEA